MPRKSSANEIQKLRLQELRDFKEFYGHCRVPVVFPENQYLATWALDMRKQHRLLKNKHAQKKRLSLTPTLTAQLNEIGFDFGYTTMANEKEWESFFRQLQQFHSEHGHLTIPKNFGDANFKKWFKAIKTEYKNRSSKRAFKQGNLTEERIYCLFNLGFEWEVEPKTAAARIKELKDFQKLHGHCRVPSLYPENQYLANWVSKMRKLYQQRKSSGKGNTKELPAKLLADLDKMKCGWEDAYANADLNVSWPARLHELSKYVEQHGDCDLKASFDPIHQYLVDWAKRLRTEFQKHIKGQSSFVTPERITELNKFGFDWGSNESAFVDETWNQRVQEFKDQQVDQEPSKILSTWMDSVRFQYKLQQKHPDSKQLLSQERIDELDGLGFEWDPPTPPPLHEQHWQDKLQELQDFHKATGHCRIPELLAPLANWAKIQQKEYWKFQKGEESTMTEDRIAELEQLGFEWGQQQEQQQREGGKREIKVVSWEQRLEDLKQFKSLFQHCRVPANYADNRSLANWVSKMRKDYRKLQKGEKSYLTPEKIAELDTIGFDWDVGKGPPPMGSRKRTSRPSNGAGEDDPNKAEYMSRRKRRREEEAEEVWSTRIGELKDFKVAHGHCSVPEKYEENRALAYWAQNIRSQYKKQTEGKKLVAGRLTYEQIAELEGLGFDWQIEKASSEIGWEVQIKALQEYKDIHGDCCVPAKFHDNLSLGYFVQSVRREYRKQKRGEKNRLNEERIQQLNALDFDWEIRDRPEPAAQTTTTTTTTKKKRTRSVERTPAKSTSKVSRDDARWDMRMQQLREYHAANGNCEPASKSSWRPLWLWLNSLRKEYARRQEGETTERLTDKRIEELNALGFSWIGPAKRQKMAEELADATAMAAQAAANAAKAEAAVNAVKADAAANNAEAEVAGQPEAEAAGAHAEAEAEAEAAENADAEAGDALPEAGDAEAGDAHAEAGDAPPENHEEVGDNHEEVGDNHEVEVEDNDDAETIDEDVQAVVEAVVEAVEEHDEMAAEDEDEDGELPEGEEPGRL